MLAEEAQGALPGEVGGGLVVALGRGVVVERVVGAFVVEVGDRLPAARSAATHGHSVWAMRASRPAWWIISGACDLGRFRRVGGGAVIDHAGVELVAGRDREAVDEAAAPAKADRADLAAAAAPSPARRASPTAAATRLAEVELADRRRARRPRWPGCRPTATGSRARPRGSRRARGGGRRRGCAR